MLLGDFLVQFVEGYLFEDLHTMADARPRGDLGHLGYPMLMSAAAGIELLGILVSPCFREEPAQNFLRYWTNYVYADNARRAAAGMAVYQLVRHGIAHNFAAKSPFRIVKGGPSHLENVGSETLLDAKTLADDLKASYFRSLVTVARGTTVGPCGETAATMQARLDELIDSNARKMAQHAGSLTSLPAAHPISPTSTSPTLVAGASGALGPIPPVAPSTSSLK